MTFPSIHSQAMSAEQFERAAQEHPRTQPHVLAAARAVLVDGQTFAAAGKPYGLNRQRVHTIVTVLHKPYLPEGWVRRQVALPQALIPQLEALEAQAQATLSTPQKPGNGT